MAKSAKQLREERAELIRKAQLFNENKADADSGVLSAEDQKVFEQMITDSQSMLDQAKALEDLEKAAASLNEPTRTAPVVNPQGKPAAGGQSQPQFISVRDGWGEDGRPQYRQVQVGSRGSADYRDAFAAYLRGGRDNISAEQFSALQSDDATQAGYLLASEQLAAGILKEVDDLLFIRRYAKIHTVLEADSLGIRKRTAKASTFGWSSELQVSTEDSTLAYGKKVLTPHHLTGMIKLSRDLVRRSTVGIEGEVRGEMARDGGEVMEDAYLTGSGSQQPLGVFTASSDGISTGRDVQTGSSTSITADGLIDAKYALKSQYRNGSRGAVRWLFHRDGIKIIAKLKDDENHYLFRPGMGIKGDDRWDDLLGFPVDESERSPNTFTTGLYVGLLANWNYYEIADALSMEIQVLYEKYAETNQIGYIARMKTDGMPTLEEAFVRLKTN